MAPMPSWFDANTRETLGSEVGYNLRKVPSNWSKFMSCLQQASVNKNITSISFLKRSEEIHMLWSEIGR